MLHRLKHRPFFISPSSNDLLLVIDYDTELLLLETFQSVSVVIEMTVPVKKLLDANNKNSLLLLISSLLQSLKRLKVGHIILQSVLEGNKWIFTSRLLSLKTMASFRTLL